MAIEKVEPSEAERLLKVLTDSIEQGKDFAIEQMPDVVQQLIVYGRCRHTVQLILAVVVALVFLRLVFWFARKAKEAASPSGDEIPWVGGSIISAIMTFLMGIGCCVGIERVAMVWLAPKLYAIEYLTRLL